jgi:hypothetical protein
MRCYVRSIRSYPIPSNDPSYILADVEELTTKNFFKYKFHYIDWAQLRQISETLNRKTGDTNPINIVGVEKNGCACFLTCTDDDI